MGLSERDTYFRVGEEDCLLGMIEVSLCREETWISWTTIKGWGMHDFNGMALKLNELRNKGHKSIL